MHSPGERVSESSCHKALPSLATDKYPIVMQSGEFHHKGRFHRTGYLHGDFVPKDRNAEKQKDIRNPD